MYGICLSLLFLLAPIEEQQFAIVQRSHSDFIVCYGLPMPTGKWIAIYRPSSVKYISVYKYDGAGHVYLGMVDDADKVESMLRRGIIHRRKLP